jgi:hypothetical protein
VVPALGADVAQVPVDPVAVPVVVPVAVPVVVPVVEVPEVPEPVLGVPGRVTSSSPMPLGATAQAASANKKNKLRCIKPPSGSRRKKSGREHP